MTHLRRALLAVVACVAAAALLVPAARAEEQPSILKAYGLDWIERVKDEAWPQPKTQRPVICLLDTGVNVTPDTPADDPSGPIVARLAIDGGTGIAQGTTFQHLHGTQMASVIAAPRNGYGTVGVFPQGRIVSVRVTEGDATYITPNDMDAGVRACRRWVLGNGPVDIAAVVMPESDWDQRPTDVDAWAKTALTAAASNGIFIAAAGNAENAELVAPLAVTNVIAVGAGDDGGSRCSFANSKQALAVLGPGCSAVRGAWPSGSSAATAAVGAMAAAIASRFPTLPPADRRNMVLAATRSSGSGRVFDGTDLAGGFANLIVPERVVNDAAVPGLTISEAGDDSTAPDVRLWRPKFRVRWHRGRLSVARTDRRRTGVIRLRVDSSSKRPLKIVGRAGKVRLAKAPHRLELWVESAAARPTWRSLSVRVRLKS